MRLLDTDVLTFEDFSRRPLPAYAILSHRWREPELSYQDMLRINDDNYAATMQEGQSYRKIMEARRVAREQGHKYTWIDTCCIDKSSSAEESFALNSMHQWYAQAAVCFAYLDDVDSPTVPAVCIPSIDFFRRQDDLRLHKEAGKPSEWFDRGWTLQEVHPLRNHWDGRMPNLSRGRTRREDLGVSRFLFSEVIYIRSTLLTSKVFR